MCCGFNSFPEIFHHTWNLFSMSSFVYYNATVDPVSLLSKNEHTSCLIPVV